MAKKEITVPVSIVEVCDELGLDVTEVENEEQQLVKRRIIRLIKFSDDYLKGTVGENYPVDDERAKQMALLIISDLYDYREPDSSKISNINKKILLDLETQLKVELRGKNV